MPTVEITTSISWQQFLIDVGSVNSALIISNLLFSAIDFGNFFSSRKTVRVSNPFVKSSSRIKLPKYPVEPANSILFIVLEYIANFTQKRKCCNIPKSTFTYAVKRHYRAIISRLQIAQPLPHRSSLAHYPAHQTKRALAPKGQRNVSPGQRPGR